MPLTENVQRNLKAIRERKGVSQKRLAEKTKLSISYISMIEQKRRTPTLDVVEALAKGLGVTPQSLLMNP